MSNFAYSFVFLLFCIVFGFLSIKYLNDKEMFNNFLLSIVFFMISKHACDYYFKKYKLENDKATSNNFH
jgi:hypothetical protein